MIDDSLTADLLSFYALPTLNPTEWIELPNATIIAMDDESPPTAAQSVANTSLESARALLEEDRDPLNVNHGSYVQQLQALGEAKKSSSTIRLAALHFSPSSFLKAVHFDTGYNELLQGRACLQASLKNRDDILKNLVKHNFDRFVNALNSIQLVYQDMQSKGLAAGDFGTKRAFDTLGELCLKSQEVFMDLLKRSDQEQLLRQRLAFCEKNAELFNLAATLSKLTERMQFREAVLAIQRARQLLEELPISMRRSVEQGLWVKFVVPLIKILRQRLAEKLTSPTFAYVQHAHFADLLKQLDVDVVAAYAEYLQRETLLAIDSIAASFKPSKNDADWAVLVKAAATNDAVVLSSSAWKTRIGVLTALNTRMAHFDSELHQFKAGFGKSCDTGLIQYAVQGRIHEMTSFLDFSAELGDSCLVSAWQGRQAIEIFKSESVDSRIRRHVQAALEADCCVPGTAEAITTTVAFVKQLWPEVELQLVMTKLKKHLLHKSDILEAITDSRFFEEHGYKLTVLPELLQNYCDRQVSIIDRLIKGESNSVHDEGVRSMLQEILLHLVCVHGEMLDYLDDRRLISDVIARIATSLVKLLDGKVNSLEARLLFELLGLNVSTSPSFGETASVGEVQQKIDSCRLQFACLKLR